MLSETAARIKEIAVSLGVNLACAESCTGGYISHLITSVPGSSLFYRGCVVAYHEDIKVAVLGVKKETISRYTVVSPQVALEMAKGVARLFGSTLGLSSTGIAGPTGEMFGKPVGTVCLGVYSPWDSFSKVLRLSGSRIEIIKKASEEALSMLYGVLRRKA